MRKSKIVCSVLSLVLLTLSAYVYSSKSVQKCQLTVKNNTSSIVECEQFIAGFIEAFYFKSQLDRAEDIRRSDFEKRAMKTRKLRTGSHSRFEDYGICFSQDEGVDLVVKKIVSDLRANNKKLDVGAEQVYDALKSRYSCG